MTGGSGSAGAAEDGWRDGRLLTCPRVSVHAAALPAGVPGHTGECGQRSKAGHPVRTAGGWDLRLRDSRIRDHGKHYS